MPFKKVLIKELMKLVEVENLSDLNKRELKVVLPCGSEIFLNVKLKSKEIKLKLVKSG